jgi:hypothetical protein
MMAMIISLSHGVGGDDGQLGFSKISGGLYSRLWIAALESQKSPMEDASINKPHPQDAGSVSVRVKFLPSFAEALSIDGLCRC